MSGIRFSRSNIRPTVLQNHFYKTGGNALSVATLANHNSVQVTLSNYLDKPHIREFVDRHFIWYQQQLEALFGIARDRAAKIFISESEFLDRRSLAVENGLGFYCSEPFAGQQPGTEGRRCWKIDACSECPLLRFYPTPQSIQDLIWFHRSLEVADARFAASNPDRWVKIWLPALALCEAVLTLLKDSRFRAVLAIEEQKFAELLASGSRKYFVPW